MSELNEHTYCVECGGILPEHRERCVIAALGLAGLAQEERLRETLPPGMKQLATMFFTWVELEILAELIDRRLMDVAEYGDEWGRLNALRTALREAQFGLER